MSQRRERITKRPAEVLLVEDNEDDVLITRRGFRGVEFSINLHHVPNGLECLNFLKKQGSYVHAPTPDLILLDLNMPVMDGREALAKIVGDEKLRKLPVVVLTTSSSERDVSAMYDMRCNSYITKPVEFSEFKQVLEELGHYWFSLNLLPEEYSC